jgi:hypothetical protein
MMSARQVSATEIHPLAVYELKMFQVKHFTSGIHRTNFRLIIINILNPTGHYMYHHQFNIQQLYALPTLYLYVLYLSDNKQRLVPLTA